MARARRHARWLCSSGVAEERPQTATAHGPRTARRFRLGTALLLFVALAVPCIRHEGVKGGGPRVMITGDSVTELASGALRDRLVDEYAVTFRYQGGQTIHDMVDELEGQVVNQAGVPTAAIVNLGTNDVVQSNPLWRQHFDEMLAVLEPVGCVNLVTVNELLRDSHPIAAAINAAIDEAVAADPERFHRVEWNVDWTGEMGPGDPDDPGPHYYSIYIGPGVHPMLPDGGWAGDGIHQSPEGSLELARRYEEALVGNCGLGA
jgi:lysophospholipase L1-like esterase